ncbi:MAG: hypothetical protein QG616_1978 [Pseudomonadota bacterium]|nr:hypothetical protein [Pseudomonadota bacterium]
MTFPTGWARKCAITIDAAQVAGSGTHSDFPVCLTVANLPSEMLDKDGSYPAQMGGGDIRFSSDSAGTTLLPCHVIEFITHNTPASGTALIYVGVDVAGTTDTTIYVWYSTADHKEQPKYNANTDADGFQGSDYVWANYEMMYALGGFGGLRNLKQANATKNIGRYGLWQSKPYTVKSSGTSYDYIAFPTLTKVGERLFCSAGYATDHYGGGPGELRVYASDDMGRTWAEISGLAIADASYIIGGKLLMQSDGTLWAIYYKINSGATSAVMYYRKSSAPYTSWGSETSFTTQTKVYLSGKPIELASGRICVPCYDIDGSGDTAPFIRWTDDDGANWTTDYLTSDGAAPGTYGAYNEFSIAEDPGTAGNVVAILRRGGYTTLFRQTSTDSCETWSSAAANIAIDAEPADMPEIQYCQDGDLLLAYSKDRAAPEYHIARSTDHGASWQSDFSILWNNGGSEPGGMGGIGGYCSFVEMAKGLFAAVYYHDSSFDGPAVTYCTHFSKVEDGQMTAWTDTTRQIAAKVLYGVDLDDTYEHMGNGALDFFNQVHQAGAFTISGWSKFNQTSDELFAFCGNSAGSNDRGFYFGYENRSAVGSPDRLQLFVGNGSGGNTANTTSAISGDTSAHRYSVFCSATSTPTFMKDATTYAGSANLVNNAGNAELGFRMGGVANGAGDSAVGRMDGWMEMWGFSTVNLGADYEATRYANENAPGTFAAAGTPSDTTGGSFNAAWARGSNSIIGASP